MKPAYKVHKYGTTGDIDPLHLELFLNSLDGEVEAILPNLNRQYTPLGVYAYTNYLLIVERTKAVG